MQRAWSLLLYSSASDRTRGKGHKMKHRRFLLNIRRHFFTATMTKHCPDCPDVVCQFLEIFKMADFRRSYLSRNVGPDDPQRSLPVLKHFVIM